jgi:hypothetical protein
LTLMGPQKCQVGMKTVALTPSWHGLTFHEINRRAWAGKGSRSSCSAGSWTKRET